MIDLKQLQKKIIDNKRKKWFNTTDIHKEFCYIYEELAEANRAYYRKEDNIWEELADVSIYLLWLAEILWIDLEEEILNKIEINEKRIYKIINWGHYKV
jgi:NTP pyrophosphatase (non-canonical NTP hydrolase)